MGEGKSNLPEIRLSNTWVRGGLLEDISFIVITCLCNIFMRALSLEPWVWHEGVVLEVTLGGATQTSSNPILEKTPVGIQHRERLHK